MPAAGGEPDAPARRDRSPARTARPSTAHTGRPRGRRRLTVRQRRDELIDAALQLFSTRSPEDVSIDDVAELAGASRALVYHYFGGKQELYVAAMASAADQLSLQLRTPQEGRPLERLQLSLRRYFDFVEDHAAGFNALLRGGPADRSGEVGEIVNGVRRLLLGRILQTIGTEDSATAVLRVTLRSWMASVETAGMEWLEHQDLPRETLERLLLEQFVALMQIAAQHDLGVAALVEQLRAEESAAPRHGATEATEATDTAARGDSAGTTG